MKIKKILILGGTGMIGHVLFRQLSKYPEYDVYSTVRDYSAAKKYFSPVMVDKIRQQEVDADNFDTIIRTLASVQPDVVVNCIGLIKQLPITNDPLSAITVNSQLPHRISLVCRAAKARLVHLSTDCIFNGRKGMYTEHDIPDAEDIYGRTKYLGEVTYPHCITLRTSFVGHELERKYGLVEWFLSQNSKIRGFTKAIYSGLPTIEIVRIINDYVLPNPNLNGIYHVSSEPISKFNLLKLIAAKYSKDIEIEPHEGFVQDQSIDSAIFRSKTGYIPPSWPELVDLMHKDYISHRDHYT